MNQTDLTKISFEISNNLAALNSKFETVISKLADHETRLHVLEHANQVENDDSFKTELLKLLAKSTIISLVVISSLTGASGLIGKILGL